MLAERYFDQSETKWTLAYIIEDVPQGERAVRGKHGRDALRKDYVVDATIGKLLAELPRTPTAMQVTAKDGLAATRRIGVEQIAG